MNSTNNALVLCNSIAYVSPAPSVRVPGSIHTSTLSKLRLRIQLPRRNKAELGRSKRIYGGDDLHDDASPSPTMVCLLCQQTTSSDGIIKIRGIRE